MNNYQKNRVEHIIWRDDMEGNSRIVHAIGYITKESRALLTVSLTSSYGKFIDAIKIPIANIISRERVKRNRLVILFRKKKGFL